MAKILAFGASNSSKSINAQLAKYATELLSVDSVNFIDLHDFEMPIFRIDRESEEGIPAAAKRFKALIEDADGIVISLAEHNGSYSAAFKNIFDWVSRINGNVWQDKPMCAE